MFHSKELFSRVLDSLEDQSLLRGLSLPTKQQANKLLHNNCKLTPTNPVIERKLSFLSRFSD